MVLIYTGNIEANFLGGLGVKPNEEVSVSDEYGASLLRTGLFVVKPAPVSPAPFPKKKKTEDNLGEVE